MQFEYTDEQAKILIDRMSFIKGLRNGILIAALLFSAIFAGGIVLIYFSLTFLGVIVSLLALLPCIIAFKFFSLANIMLKCIKKKDYGSFKVKCKEAKAIEGNGLWHEVTTDEDLKMYYYSETPHNKPNPGTELEAIVLKNKKGIMFLIDPIA